jgi:hypothetical protein
MRNKFKLFNVEEIPGGALFPSATVAASLQESAEQFT